MSEPLIDLRADHLQIVRGILKKAVPELEVWAFGSRAKWLAKPYSDLDLAIIGDTPLSLALQAALTDDFAESDLPFRVDVVDWATTKEKFREIIERDKVVVQKAGPSRGVSSERKNQQLVGRVSPQGVTRQSPDASADVGLRCANPTYATEFQTLADLAAPIKNAIVGGPFGSNLVSKDYVESGIPVIRGQNMGGKWVSGEFVYVSKAKAQSLNQNTARPGDLVFTQRGTLGQVAIVPRGQFTEYIVSQSQMKITVAPDKADVAFLYYLFMTQEQLQYIFNAAIQTGVPHTNLGILKATPVRLPPLPVQRQISSVMNALDDRITLLRETNATLQAIAQALFKSWFVDFDPVHAKQQGRAPEGMDEATAALFPDSFEESELGLVPRGWNAGLFSDVARLHKGSINPLSKPDVVFEHYSLPAFDSGQMPVFEAGSEIKSNKTLVPASAVLLSKLNPHILRVWMPTSAGATAVCSTEFLAFEPKDGASKEFLYCAFSAPQFQQLLCQLVTGTSNSHQRVKPDGVLAMQTTIPSPSMLKSFEAVAHPVFERIGHNRQQAQTISTIRDTLLPRLISGQLRLPEMPDLSTSPPTCIEKS